jgi:tRNA pseudouridine55 synthase
MLLLIGKPYTRLSNQFLNLDKAYLATLHLGITTDTYDVDGTILERHDKRPSPTEIDTALLSFQGTLLQTPPMFSAKKVAGKKLYELARQGITIERTPVPVTLQTELVDYTYPYLTLRINCSKGTYIRSLAHDLGELLGCGAHLSALTRTRSGSTLLEECCDGSRLNDPTYDWTPFLKREIPRAPHYRPQ